MQTMSDFFSDNDQFAKLIGVELVSVDQGTAKAKLSIGPQHCNVGGVVHGGAIFTLADFAFAAASNSYGRLAYAIQANIQFLKSVATGVLFAEAKEVSLHHKIANYIINVRNEQQELIAVFQGIVYRKEQALPFVQS
jgi:acyl-CoA thioesterase